MSKLFCHNCGTEYDPERNNYCSNCGTPFIPKKEIPKGIIFFEVFFRGLFLLALIFCVSTLFSWLFGNCGVIHVSKAIDVLEKSAEHLYQIEIATVENVRPPSYLISQIDGDFISLSNTTFDACVKPAGDAMLEALYRASRFFPELPVNILGDDGYPIMLSGEILQRKYQYEAALRGYYGEIETLKLCQPFCNLNLLFTLPEKAYPEFLQ